MKKVAAMAVILGAQLGLVSRASADSVRAPEDYNDAKVISSILIQPRVVQCLSSFDVAFVDTIKRFVWADGVTTEYTLEGTVIDIDIARGRKTLVVVESKRRGVFGPVMVYSCRVK